MTPDQTLNAQTFVASAQQVDAAVLTGPAIASRLRAGDLTSIFGLLPNPDPVLKAMGADMRVYRSLLADPRVKSARKRRWSAVLSMEHGLAREASTATPARVRKACEALLARLDLQRIVRQLTDGAMYGFRVAEIMWAPMDGLIQPADLVAKPGEWFGFDPETAALKFRPRGSLQGELVPARKFIVVGSMRSWENPYGEPDLASVFWPVTFKRGGLKFWVQFVEKYGMPWAVGKLPRTSTQEEHDALADKLSAMVRDAIATVPDDASVELLSISGSANSDMHERMLNWCNAEISVALLGNNQSVEANSNRASATAAQSVEAALRDDDAAMVAAGINELLAHFVAVNWPGATPPVFAFWQTEEIDETLAKRDETLRKAGATFTTQYFLRAYKLQPGDLADAAPPGGVPGAPGAAPGAPGAAAGADATLASFAEGAAADVPADQAAIDAAIARLPADEIQAAMAKLLAPALAAIQDAATPEQVQQALAEAWPDMDASALETLMEQAYFVADVVGRDSAVGSEQ
jgi:phage gp29-like protein